MSSPVEQRPDGEPPQWAVEQARGELYDVSDQVTIAERAREIVREAAVLEEERHDEYDDPDQGGEG